MTFGTRKKNGRSSSSLSAMLYSSALLLWIGCCCCSLSSNQVSAQDCSTATPIATDVVVIGAGMAGIKAAARIKEVAGSNLNVVVLESTNRIGGRVRTHNQGFGDNNAVIVEDGANWIYKPTNGDPDNAVYLLAQQYGVSNQEDLFVDISTYEYDPIQSASQAIKEDTAAVMSTSEAFRTGAYAKALKYGDRLWEESENQDFSVVQNLQDNGYDPNDPLQYAAKWMYIDFEHADEDISHYAIFDFSFANAYLVNDQRQPGGGFESIVQKYAAENGIVPIYDRRVSRIKYDDNEGDRSPTASKARVFTTDSAGNCYVYQSKRVISTVSVGVLNKNLIEFDPPLAYPAPDNNPMDMQLYIKIFYQFPTKFWDDTDYIQSLKTQDNLGSPCFLWQNLNNFIPGSRTLVCSLMTKEFDRIVGGEANRNTADLSDAQLLDLLEPLRRAYPNFVEPTDIYYPPINKDVDFGFGAYSDWKTGYTPWQYYRFFGGGSDNYYLATTGPGEADDDVLYGGCIHNGCNNANEWVLHLSGAAACLEYYEMVYGAYYSGEISASYVLQSLGYQLENQWVDQCYFGITDKLSSAANTFSNTNQNVPVMSEVVGEDENMQIVEEIKNEKNNNRNNKNNNRNNKNDNSAVIVNDGTMDTATTVEEGEDANKEKKEKNKNKNKQEKDTDGEGATISSMPRTNGGSTGPVNVQITINRGSP